jgi:hypothetical protein
MTQEYTPVSWQDETTSQQGTLINAERLNQMQTAHHYADGLEEVDAIPTADPGVSYHKIVYCTADSTIYRWDGTEWTKDIDDETKALLQQEIARATAAEGELAQDIADEATARETADTAMQADISDLGDAIEAEETARRQADTALGTRITNETSARETADTALGNRITAEATARADADTALGGRIDTEQARAEAAEQANAQAIANTYTKAEIDTTLALKADQATTYTKTETDTAIQNALDNYATMVRTANNQTIAGIKTFTGVSINTTKWRIKNANEGISTTPSAQVQTQPKDIVDANDAQIYFEQMLTNTDGSRAWRQNLYGTGGHRKILHMQVGADGTGYLTAPWRTYNTLNADDVVTIGTLKQSTDVVHTSGAETIQGTKTFYAYSEFSEVAIKSGRTGSDNIGGIGFFNASGTRVSQVYADTDGRIILNTLVSGAILAKNQRAYSAGNTEDVATIGTLDAYSPMVRTSGAQNIAGAKTFQDGIVLKKMNTDRDNIPAEYHNQEITHINDANNAYLAQLVLTSNVSAQDPTKRTMLLQVRFYGKNGNTSSLITIAQGDVQGD